MNIQKRHGQDPVEELGFAGDKAALQTELQRLVKTKMGSASSSGREILSRLDELHIEKDARGDFHVDVYSDSTSWFLKALSGSGGAGTRSVKAGVYASQADGKLIPETTESIKGKIDFVKTLK